MEVALRRKITKSQRQIQTWENHLLSEPNEAEEDQLCSQIRHAKDQIKGLELEIEILGYERQPQTPEVQKQIRIARLQQDIYRLQQDIIRLQQEELGIASTDNEKRDLLRAQISSKEVLLHDFHLQLSQLMQGNEILNSHFVPFCLVLFSLPFLILS